MKFKSIHHDGHARAGVFESETEWGSLKEVKTPTFMPVGTAGTVKAVPPWELEKMGAQIVLGNTYHLYLRPGHERVERLGGLARMMKLDTLTLTDSGGFQIFSLTGLRKISDDGVWFQSHLDGSKHWFDAEQSMRIQRALSSNFVMAFDECPPFPATEEEVLRAMKRTYEWAQRGLGFSLKPFQKRFGIIQGGLYPHLREQSLKEITSLPFDAFAIGGLSIGEKPEEMQKMAQFIAPKMPVDRPRYLMGVGRPEDLVEGVRGGVDLFDCVMPTRNGRNGQAFTWKGKVNIKNLQYIDDTSPLDESCPCPTCANFTKAYLRHLFIAGEALSAQLLSMHNLWHYLELMRSMREAILANRFDEWRESFYTRRNQPVPA